MKEIDIHSSRENKGNVTLSSERPYIAIASQDGLFINLHLDESDKLRIYRTHNNRPELIDIREVPGAHMRGIARWKELTDLLKDCSCLLVNGIAPAPRSILMNAGIAVYIVEGFVEKAVNSIASGKGVGFMIMKEMPEDSSLDVAELGCEDDPLY